VKVIGNLTKDAIIRAAVSEGFTVSSSVGSGVVFETANTQGIAATYDTSNDKVVIVFRDSGANGQAVVGTVSGTSISFGTPVQFESGDVNNNSVVFDSSNNKVIISYVDTGNSDYGTSVVGTVSGTSISFGTPVVFASVGTSQVSSAFDTSANKVVIAYRESSGKAIVGTVSGTSISFGSEAEFETGSTYSIAAAYDVNANKTVIAYRDNGDSDKGKAVVGTISGTSISFGSIVEFGTGNSRDMVMSYDPVAQKILLVYKILSSPNPGYSIVGTVSGTSISFGTRVEYHAGSTDVNRVVYDSNAQKHVILFRDQDTSPYRGKIIEATISGTSVSYGAEFEWSSTSFSEPAVTYDPDQKKVVLAYVDANNSTYGTARVYTTGYTSATGGTIADGKAVIVNANGTVSSVSQSTLTEAKGSNVEFESGATHNQSVVYDSANDKVVIFYRDAGNSDYGTAIVGTVSGDSISFGTAVVFESAYSTLMASVFDSSNNKIVLAYRDGGNGGAGTAIVGTVSGTSISFGSPVVFESGNTNNSIGISFDTSANKVVIAFRDNDDSNYGKAIVGTVSGTSISFGSAATFNSATTTYVSIAYDVANNKHVIGYVSSSGNAKVATVSGTSISFGSATEFESGATILTKVVNDPNINRVLIFYADGGDNDKGKATIGSVSGASISFTGQSTFYSAAQVTRIGASFNTSINKVTISTRDNGGALNMFTSSVTTSAFTHGSAFAIDASITTGEVNNVHVSTADRTVLAFTDGGDSSKGKAVVYTGPGDVTNLTSENFVGFMDGAALDGTNGEILSSCSIARNQTSLTPGQTYFVTPAGALSTSAGSPSVTAGTAISSTEIIVKG
jgi:hypothetical protein